MCHRITCRKCGKPSWAGCESHVEEALRGVPRADRCRCREDAAAAKAQRSESERPWWARLMGS